MLNRNNLGGIAAPVAQLSVDGFTIGQSSATYRTSQGTYFVFRAEAISSRLTRLLQLARPRLFSAWSVTEKGQGSPWVTTMDGTNNAIVWVIGAQGDGQLHGYNGDTGAVIYAGTDVMSGTRKWNSGMVARGSIYVANDNRVYAFRIPSGEHLLLPPYYLQLLLRFSTPTATATATSTPTATVTTTPTATPTATTTQLQRRLPRPSESDTYTQANAHSEISCDTEAAAESAAKARRSRKR